MRVLPAVILVLVLTGCSDGDDGDDGAEATPTGTPTSESTPEEPPTSSPTRTAKVEEQPGTRIVVNDSDFGPMLFDARGQAIYLFDVESTEEPRCYGACAEAWPPVLTDGEPVAGDGVRPRLLGTTERKDGQMQVTYGGHPLYFYAHEGPGEVECHDVFLNGGYWYVVQPDGDRAP